MGILVCDYFANWKRFLIGIGINLFSKCIILPKLPLPSLTKVYDRTLPQKNILQLFHWQHIYPNKLK